jgi:hypothetical protein
MKRITGTYAVVTEPSDSNTGTTGFFTDSTGNPNTSTVVTAAWCNDVQEEIVSVATALGTTLNGSSNNQMLTAINGLITTAINSLEASLNNNISALNNGTDSNTFFANLNSNTTETQIGANFSGVDPAYLFNNSNAWGLKSNTGGIILEYIRSTSQITINGTVNISAGTYATNAVAYSQLTGETIRATAAESLLTTNLAAETTARQNADSTLQTNITSEINRATAAENTLTQNLSTETTNRTNAISGITNSFGNLLTTNGYQKIIGGLIIQWGKTANYTNESSQTITFPIAFPTACLNAQATLIIPNNSTAQDQFAQIVGVPTLTSVSLYCQQVSNNTYPVSIYWMAIGY